MQKKLRNDINATSDPGKRAEKKKERNKVLIEIHDTLQREQQTEMMRLVEEVETHKDVSRKMLRLVEEVETHIDDSRKMFQVVKQLQRRKQKKKIIVNGEHGVTTNEIRQVEIVTHFFNDMFNKDTERKIKEIQPKKMKKTIYNTRNQDGC